MREEELFAGYILPLVLAIIMFGMGTSLEVKDFKRLIKKPRPVLTGLSSQMILLPAMAFALAAISPIPAVYKAGLVLIAACPGGAASNLITYLLRGTVALSVSLTALNSLLILFTIPLLVNLGLKTFMDASADIRLPFGETFFNVFVVTVLPVGCGLWFRKKYEEKAEKLQGVFKWLLPLLLAAAFAGVLFIDDGSNQFSWQKFINLFPYALALNTGAMVMAYFVSRTLLSNHRHWYTVAIEVGLQNSGLALFVAGSLLRNQQLAIMAVIYGSFTFFTTFLIAWLMKKKSTSKRNKT